MLSIVTAKWLLSCVAALVGQSTRPNPRFFALIESNYVALYGPSTLIILVVFSLPAPFPCPQLKLDFANINNKKQCEFAGKLNIFFPLFCSVCFHDQSSVVTIKANATQSSWQLSIRKVARFMAQFAVSPFPRAPTLLPPLNDAKTSLLNVSIFHLLLFDNRKVGEYSRELSLEALKFYEF